MNNLSQIIFDVSHVNRNLRDTLEFVLPNEISVQAYEQRKTVIGSVLDGKSFLSRFLEDNKEKLEPFKKNYQEFFDEVYGEGSTILVKTNEDNIRVDHAQNIVLLRGAIYLGETLRDIMFTHFYKARQENQLEDVVKDYVDVDERFDRAIKTFLLLQEYQKSFMEFQKVMSESQGKPTPQSNFIVQNELNVLAGMIRFERQHCHFIDNKSLDIYDKVIQLVDMCEGKRERRDNKQFPDLFKETIESVGSLVNENAPKYNDLYATALKEMIDTIKQANENKKSEA